MQQQASHNNSCHAMAAEPFIGRWKVLRTNPLCGPMADLEALEDLEFELEKEGDVYWYPVEPDSEESRSMPLFQCDTFEVLRERKGIGVAVNLRFGVYQGHVLEFRVETIQPASSRLLYTPGSPSPVDIYLSYPGWCTIHCKHISPAESSPTSNGLPIHPFHLLAALEEELFTDAELRAANGVRIKVHRRLLELVLDSRSINALNGLPEGDLRVLLHFVYARCLPKDVSAEVLERCLSAVKDYKGFEQFRDVVSIYKRNSGLAKKLIGCVHELHGAANAICLEFGGRPLNAPAGVSTSTSSTSSSSSKGDGGNSSGGGGGSGDAGSGNATPSQGGEALVYSPLRLSNALRESLKAVAVGVVKFIQLCHLFVSSRSALSPDEQLEVLTYSKACLPVFFGQMSQFLTALKSCSSFLNFSVRQELATHFVPQLETLTEIVNRLGFTANELLDDVIKNDLDMMRKQESLKIPQDENSSQRGSTTREAPKGSLKQCLDETSRHNLQRLHHHLSVLYSYLVQEKETFNELGPLGKIRIVSWQMELLSDELPLFLLRLEKLSALLEERLDFATFKFCFIAAAAFVDFFLNKFRGMPHDNENASSFFNDLCAVIQSDTFTQTLFSLQLLESSDQDQEKREPVSEYSKYFKMDRKLDLCHSIQISPRADESSLADQVGGLLFPEDCTMAWYAPDMVAVVHYETEDTGLLLQDEIPCHRMVLAARCPYFRRALLSGMKEDIERRINVHDTSPAIFRLFLQYLYCGHIEEIIDMPMDIVSELLFLSDRYEMDTLKDVCESALERMLDSETVLTLLNMADHLNSTKLKASSIDYVLKNPYLTNCDSFHDLDRSLQREVEELLAWGQMASHKSLGTPPESLVDLRDMTSRMTLRTGFDSDGDEIETIPLTHDSNQLETCVVQLRDILGSAIPQDQLVRVALAADYDVNRAVNHFFAEGGVPVASSAEAQANPSQEDE